MTEVGGPSSWWAVTPPGRYKRARWESHGEAAVLYGLCFISPGWRPWAGFPSPLTVSWRWDKHFPVRVAVGHGIYCSNQMKTRMVTKSYDLLFLEQCRTGTAVVWMWTVHTFVFNVCLGLAGPFEAHLEEDGRTSEDDTCLRFTSASSLPLCKPLPQVPATTDKVTCLAHDGELETLKPWTHTRLSSLQLSLSGILSLQWKPNRFRKKAWKIILEILLVWWIKHRALPVPHSTTELYTACLMWDSVSCSPGWLWNLDSLAVSPKCWDNWQAKPHPTQQILVWRNL